MKAIQPITLWIAGETKTANVFQMRIVGDDLSNYASLFYQLGHETPAPDPADKPAISWLQDGNLSIQGAEYQAWNNDPNANDWIYNWAAQKLNLTYI
jgi:hypothetical protein